MVTRRLPVAPTNNLGDRLTIPPHAPDQSAPAIRGQSPALDPDRCPIQLSFDLNEEGPRASASVAETQKSPLRLIVVQE